ncbi:MULTISPECIES: glycosyltransferase [unclassified Microcoleus]|uniref:glycosyltransferase n=1 Tax=unclassified Microcoleus TaxID=2642155 RepID=UPI001D82ACE6|nr:MULTISPECIES: glycosyltransferase [unclassified Microcoleus]MCC3597407.1 glycosyltransferase [Microcoleus sp. PH2017_26_ELK_O_A]MCC3622612.1 glycosyltransferase [Microcoleus sp. PH2017_36_ELK_O_B]
MAIKMLEIEFTEQINPIRGLEKYEGVRILVRYRGRPIGWGYVNNNPWEQTISADRVRQTIVEQMGKTLIQLSLAEQLAPIAEFDRELPPMSVVICTRDRTDLLKGALESLLALDYPNREIIVVDNAPSNNRTAEYVAGLPVRYVKEERPGLDWARNRGIAEARHEIIAFTDDDARPDRGWLRSIAAGFADPEVMAVSGLVSAAELETMPQQQFELVYGGMLQYLHKFKVEGNKLSVKDLLWACNYGVGANMAFRRQIFEAVGNFDVALDVGTATRGAGDVEMFHRILAKGYTTFYDPSTLVWHLHRRSDKALSRQLQDNGRSFGAYLLTCDRNRTVGRAQLVHFVVFEWLGWWLLRRLRNPGKLPRKFVVSELLGALQSPFAYREAQLQARQLVALAEEESQEVEPQVMAGGVQ